MQVSNSTIQNDSRFQRYVSGGQINGNSNMYSGPTYPVQHSNYHNSGYISQCGQIVNGKYFPGKALDLNTGQICDNVASQRNDCVPREPVTQVPLRNLNLINGNDGHFVPSGTNALQSCFAAQPNPWNANAPQTAPANGSSLQANRMAAGCPPYSLEALSRFGGGASAAGVQGQRELTTSQQTQRIANFSNGESTSPSVNFYGTLSRNAYPPASQNGSHSASSCENVIDVKETQRNPLSMMAERMGELRPRNYTNYIGNLLNSGATGNKSASGLGASRSGPGNSLPVRSVTQVRPSFHSQNSRPDGNLSVNSPWTAQQSFQYPTGVQQHHQSATNKLRTLLQGADYQTQNSHGTTQPSLFPDAKRDVGVAARPVGPSQMPKPAPNQIPWTVAASQNAYSCASTLQNPPQPPQRRLSDQPISDPPPYPKTQRYFVTVTQDRPGTGFTAKNVIYMNDHHASAFSKELQLTSKEKTASLDSGITNGEISGSRDPKQGETQLPAAITRAESGFNMHKPTNPLKCAGSSGQRAVAVVPPISQQSSNLEDEESGIINANEGLPFQIKNVWSLTKDKCATQQKLDDLFPESAASDAEAGENSKCNVVTISAPPGLTNSSSPSEEVVDSHQKTSQPSNSISSSTCSTRALPVSDKDIKTANVSDLQPTLTEVAQLSDEISHVSSNANDSGTLPSSDAADDSGTLPSSDAADDSGTLPSSDAADDSGTPPSPDAFGKSDKVESEKEALDFTSVPVFRWTIEKLRKLISVYEWKQNFHPVDFDIEKLHSIYGSCIDPGIPDIFKSDLYLSIMNEASCISPPEEHDAIFSQIRRKYLKQVMATCHILKHNASYSENAVYKSSWLNLNEQLDDIDKEYGFPLSLRFNQHILEDEHQDQNESGSGNLAEVPNYQETVESSEPLGLTEVKIPASSEGICPSNDHVISSQIKMSTSEKVITSEKVNASEGTLAKVPILQAAEKRAPPAIPIQTDLPASEDVVDNLTEPLSSAQTAFPASEEVVGKLTEPLSSAQTTLPASKDLVDRLTDPMSSAQTALPASEVVVDSLTGPLLSTRTDLPTSEDVDELTDPLSSVQTAFPASEDVADKLTEPLSSAQTAFPASKDAVDRQIDPVSSAQTDFPASEDIVDNLTDPLSPVELSVLSGEAAISFFNEIMNEAKDNQIQARKPGSENDGNQMDIELPEQPVKGKETSPMETYCCLARWLCVMSGYRERSVCSCQKKEESNLEKVKRSASINTTDMLPATRPVAEDPADNIGNARSAHNTGGPAQPGGNVRGVNDASVLPQHQTVRHPEQSSMHASKGTNLGIHSEAETRLKTPSDHSGRGKQANPENFPKAVSNGSKVLGAETKHVNSSCSEVRKMSSEKSVPLGFRRSSKDLPRTKIEGRDIDCKLRRTESASIGCDVVVAKDGTLSKAVGSTDVKDVRRMPVLKPLALTKNHNQKDVNLPEKDMMRRKQKRGISNPSSSADDQDDPASDLEKNSKKKKPCIEAASEIKMPALKRERTLHHDHKAVEDQEESWRRKVRKAVKHESSSNVLGSTNGNKKILQMGKVLKVINKEAAGSVRLVLYGSSPQKRNGTLHSHKRKNGKPVKLKSDVRTPLPAVMGFDGPSEETKAFEYSPGKSVAKQQVFDRWKSSLVPEKYNRQSKHRSSTRNTTSRARVAQITPTELPKRPTSPKSQTIADSSKLKVPPLKLKAMILSGNKFNRADKEFSHQTSVNFPSKNASKRVTVEEQRRSLTAGPLVKLNKLVLEKRKRLQAAHRPYTRHEAQVKSKYELGNPAVVPLQKDGMLQFKLLPESFNFKDSRDDRESVKPKDLTKTKIAVGGQKEENLKTKSWKLEGSWSKSSKSRDLTRPEGKTAAGSTQSDTVFQEYKKKHMAKGKK